MGNTTFELDAWRGWQAAQGLSSRTIDARRATVGAFLARTNTTPASATTTDILVWLGRPGITQNSRVTFYKQLHAFFHWMAVTGRRPDDPMEALPRPRTTRGLPRPVQDTELARILAHAPQPIYMMILLASLQGLRVHEVAKLRGEDVDLAAGTVLVVGKGHAETLMPLHVTVAAFAPSFPANGYWFPSSRGGHLHADTVSRRMREVMRAAGCTKTPHQLRHWFGTTLVHNGVDLRTVQELMRHASLSTTQVYTLVDDTQRRAGIDTLRVS